MKARYQYRFYPDNQQKQSLAQLFGCVRVVWNDALAICKESKKLPSNNQLQKLVITQAKKTEARRWLSRVSVTALQQSVADLGVAFKNFFDSLNGKRKGKRVGSPKFKQKSHRQSARFTRRGFAIKGNEVYLAKIGNVKPIWSRSLPSVPSTVTVLKDYAGRYFLSFVVEVEPVNLTASNPSVGIDLGLKTFAVLSTGEKVCSPDYSKLDKRIRRQKRKLARQEKGSKRWEKTRKQIAKLYNRIADTRKDFLHKLSTRVINENQVIALEEVNVSGVIKNRHLKRAISLQGWREFIILCEGKSQKLTREFVVINRWKPTSQVCSECGFRWSKIDLSIRSVVCLNCAAQQGTDENAAKNIEMVGMGHRHDLKWTGSDCETTSVASCCELSRTTVASTQ